MSSADWPRRAILKLSLSLSGVLALGGLIKYLAYPTAPASPTRFTLAAPATYAIGMATFVPQARVYLVRDEAGLYALSALCTHLGCTINAGSQLIAMRVQGDPDSTKNGVFYLHSDHLGSTSLTTCGNSGGCGGVPNGGVVARQLYDAWGNVRSGGGLPTDIAFTGQRSDTGLMYFKARYYDGAVGRFVSADTIVPDGHNPQQFNRYAYGLNNPVKYTDPSGHCVPGEDGCHTGDLEAPLTQQINQTAMSWERTPYFALSPADPTTFTGNAENGFGNTTFAFNHQGLYGGLGHLHSGIDIGMPAGTRLQAMDYGVVLCRNCMIGQGETSVAIRYGRYAVVYGHATIAEGLDDGDVVLPGTYVGDSGIGNNYAHLHLEMRDMTVGNAASPDEFVNPLYFFSSNVVNAMNIQWQDFANPSTGAADPDYGPKSMISYNRRTSDNQLGNFWQGNLSSVSWAPRPDLDRRYGP